jgi:hypothetical protein
MGQHLRQGCASTTGPAQTDRIRKGLDDWAKHHFVQR